MTDIRIPARRLAAADVSASPVRPGSPADDLRNHPTGTTAIPWFTSPDAVGSSGDAPGMAVSTPQRSATPRPSAAIREARAARLFATTPGRGVWTAGRDHAGALARVVVWLLVLAGPVALLWLGLEPRIAVVGASQAPTGDPGPDMAVAAVAEASAVAWLNRGAPPEATPSVQASTLRVTAPPPTDEAAGIWSALVMVTTVTSDASSTAVTTYLQVPVLVEGADTDLPAMTAWGSPSVVPGPRPVADGDGGPDGVDGGADRDGAGLDDPAPTGVDYAELLPDTDPRAVVATAFVTSLLTGADVTPLTAPGSTVGSIPAMTDTVDVTEVRAADLGGAGEADRSEVAVNAVIAGDVAQADPRTVTYYLDLRSRDGRWEVAELRTAPVATAVAPSSAPSAPTNE